MSNYATLKSAIQSVIKTNGNNEITGQLLQNELLAMINTLGYGYQFMGVAVPDTVPGTPDAKVFYIAYEPGTYTNFDGIAVTGLCVLKYVSSWTKEDIPVSGGGGSVTPNDEDLAFVNSKLQFANRISPTNTNGMNYVILRMNKTFSEQVTTTNTIYEIRYNFDLNGNSVNISSGCVLLFNGGMIANGTIVGNKTKIVANSDYIFGIDLTISTGFYVDFWEPEMFSGATADVSINRAISAAKNNKCCVCLRTKDYTLNATINIPGGIHFGGQFERGPYDDFRRPRLIVNGDFPAITISPGSNVASGITIENLELVGNGTSSENSRGISYVATDKIFTLNYIRNIFMTNFRYGLYFDTNSGIGYNNFEKIKVDLSVIGVRIKGVSSSTWLNSNSWKDCVFVRLGIGGVYIRGLISVQTNLFQLCTFESIGHVDVFSQSDYTTFGGVFAFSCEGGANVTEFSNCYFESIAPPSSVIPAATAYENKKNCVIEVINGTGAKISNCIISSYLHIYVINGYGHILTNFNYYGMFNNGDSAGLIDWIVGGTVTYNTIYVRESNTIFFNRSGNIKKTLNTVQTPEGVTLQRYQYKDARIDIDTGYSEDTLDDNNDPIKKGQTNTRPSHKVGRVYYDSSGSIKRLICSDGTSWLDGDGMVAMRKVGTTVQRTALTGMSTGYQYYDTDLGKYVCYNGTAWVNLDGSAL